MHPWPAAIAARSESLGASSKPCSATAAPVQCLIHASAAILTTQKVRAAAASIHSPAQACSTAEAARASGEGVHTVRRIVFVAMGEEWMWKSYDLSQLANALSSLTPKQSLPIVVSLLSKEAMRTSPQDTPCLYCGKMLKARGVAEHDT